MPPLTLSGKAPLIPAPGVLLIKILEAENLKNQEALKLSDPYCKVIIAGKCCARTRTIDDTRTAFLYNIIIFDS